MTPLLFLTSVVALLAVPGPPNTLVAVAGAQAGLRRAVQLIPAVLAGYLTTVIPAALLGRHAAEHWPLAAILLKLCAAGWILLLALRLWRAPVFAGSGRGVTAGQVYLTTMLNPKALIAGAVLLPAPGSAAFPAALAIFAAAAGAVAAGWALGGQLTRSSEGDPARIRLLQRAASVWLALISGSLLASLLAVS